MLDQTNRLDATARLAEEHGYRRTAIALQRLNTMMLSQERGSGSHIATSDANKPENDSK